MGSHSVPFQGVSASKHAAAVVASMFALLHVHALLMPLQIRLAHETLGAVFTLAWEGVLSLFAVRFHVRFEVVTAAEEFATPCYVALEVGFLLGGKFPRGSSRALSTRAWRGALAGHHQRRLESGPCDVQLVWLGGVLGGSGPLCQQGLCGVSGIVVLRRT